MERVNQLQLTADKREIKDFPFIRKTLYSIAGDMNGEKFNIITARYIGVYDNE